MATWSLRLRPVCSRAPAAPMRSVSTRSIAMWTSSSARSQRERAGARSRGRSAESPASMASASASVMTPCLASMRACAIEPRMSSAHRRSSTAATHRSLQERAGRPLEPPAPGGLGVSHRRPPRDGSASRSAARWPPARQPPRAGALARRRSRARTSARRAEQQHDDDSDDDQLGQTDASIG